MITVQTVERIAEIAKIDIKGSELERAREELDRMISFAREISEVADSIETQSDEAEKIERSLERAAVEMDSERLSEYGMYIKEGFFRIKAGERR